MNIINKIIPGLTDHDNKVEYLLVHHTGGEGGLDSSNQTFEIVRDFHVNTNGWTTIGYHYFIDKQGQIYQGRPDFFHGGHCTGSDMNHHSLGICLAGNFDVSLPSQAQIDSLTALLRSKMAEYNLTADKIVPHRHFANPYKSCFGTLLKDDWASNLVKLPPPTAPVADTSLNTLIKQKLAELQGLVGKLT